MQQLEKCQEQVGIAVRVYQEKGSEFQVCFFIKVVNQVLQSYIDFVIDLNMM